MLGTVAALARWFALGGKEAAAMVWMTWWPLVLGFLLSGLVQSAATREGLRTRLGVTSPTSVATAALLGALSSSCSYAASAMSRALFARGASWTNALVFMVASTNLVIELGVVLYLMLGWQFLVAQVVGGALMVVVLAATTRLLFSVTREAALRQRVDATTPSARGDSSWFTRLKERDTYVRGARYTWGDLTMVRRELLLGFLAAGFLSVHVPASWWSHLFYSGHGAASAVLDAVLAPLVALLAFVCSVGNIPLAAALWAHGVAFGGVVAFIFADLITLPLLAIYRRFYGARAALRLLVLLWATMSVGGLAVNGLFHLTHLLPTSHHLNVLNGDFPLGATLVLNVAATLALVATWRLARRRPDDPHVATDPVCGMTVETAAAAASARRDGTTFYFCSLRCRDRFVAGEPDHGATTEDVTLDPVCAMAVAPTTARSARGPDGLTYYFCGEGCEAAFLGRSAPTGPDPEIGHHHP